MKRLIRTGLAGVTAASASSDYMLLCNEPVATLEQIKGKRLRSAGPPVGTLGRGRRRGAGDHVD